MSDLTLALVVAVIAVGLAGTWFLLCRLGVVPERGAKWSLLVAGAIVSVGILPLVRVLFRQKKQPAKVEIVESVAPTDAEVKAVDQEIDEAVRDGEQALEDLAEIDRAEEVSRTLGDADPDAGSISRERLRRRLQERSE